MRYNEILSTINLSKEEMNLLESLISLKAKLDDLTEKKFNRINPFIESVFDWKTKGDRIFPDKNVTIYDSCTIVGEVEVGKNTWIGPYTAIDGSAGVKIGENCSISAGVNIVSHDTVRWALSGGKADYEYAPISIGNCCFIGTGAFIGKGVSIGNHCLIGAGAVVVNNIPDYSIALGVPAKVVGNIDIDLSGNIQLRYFK